MRIDKNLWREMLQRNAENEFRIARLELKISRLESLLEKQIKSSEGELEECIDALLKGPVDQSVK